MAWYDIGDWTGANEAQQQKDDLTRLGAQVQGNSNAYSDSLLQMLEPLLSSMGQAGGLQQGGFNQSIQTLQDFFNKAMGQYNQGTDQSINALQQGNQAGQGYLSNALQSAVGSANQNAAQQTGARQGAVGGLEGMLSQLYNQTTGALPQLQNYDQAGLAAGDKLRALLGMGGDSGVKLSDLYNIQNEEMTRAGNAQAQRQGMANSPAALAAMSDQRRKLLASETANQTNLLSNLYTQALGQANAVQTGNINNLQQQNQMKQNFINPYQNLASMQGGVYDKLPDLSSLYQNYGNQSANAANQMGTNLSNLYGQNASNMAQATNAQGMNLAGQYQNQANAAAGNINDIAGARYNANLNAATARFNGQNNNLAAQGQAAGITSPSGLQTLSSLASLYGAFSGMQNPFAGTKSPTNAFTPTQFPANNGLQLTGKVPKTTNMFSGVSY